MNKMLIIVELNGLEGVGVYMLRGSVKIKWFVKDIWLLFVLGFLNLKFSVLIGCLLFLGGGEVR